jgi:hypothetical protein
MDAYGLLSCNGKQTFSSRVVIGKGNPFAIGPIWTRTFPLDPNFQMAYYPSGEAEATSDLSVGTASKPHCDLEVAWYMCVHY